MRPVLRFTVREILIPIVVVAVFGLLVFSCSEKHKPAVVMTRIPDAPRTIDSYYNQATEVCYKGVVYVIFAPNSGGAVGSVRFDTDGRLVTCVQ